MVKKGLIMVFVVYFFIIQAFIAGLIWQDSHFYTLGCVNLLFLILFFFGTSVFSGDNGEKKQENAVKYPIVKEKIEHEKVSEPIEKETVNSISEEKKSENDPFKRVVSEKSMSESNIEYIKTKINRAKRKPLREGSSIYRFLVFLLAILGLGGILYAFWESLDFIALIIGAFAMLIFIGVCFKAANLWRKSLFSSIYFLTFVLALLLGLYGMIFANSSLSESLKESISTFFYGVKGEEITTTGMNREASGSIYQATGTVINFSLTGESIYSSGNSLSGNQQSGDDKLVSENNVSENNVSEPTVKEVKPVENQNQQEVSQPINKVNVDPEVNNNSSSQVSIIEAIKHLIKTYNIPLSKSTSSKFTHVSKSSSLYPYMKTALEKRMIGTNTNPEMIVSCDVYMVMKGIAEGWNIAKSDELKENYWNVAESKGLLNGCTKGSKLTYANL